MQNNGYINRQLSCGYFKQGIVKQLGVAPNLQRTINMPAINGIEHHIEESSAPL
jgi:hypothetical protein